MSLLLRRLPKLPNQYAIQMDRATCNLGSNKEMLPTSACFYLVQSQTPWISWNFNRSSYLFWFTLSNLAYPLNLNDLPSQQQYMYILTALNTIV